MTNPGTPAGTPPPIAICPHCRTQLRLLRPPAEFTPIKCYRCQSMFYIEAIETAPVEGPLPAPAAPAMMPLPGSRLTTESNLPPLTMPPPPPPPVLPTIWPVAANTATPAPAASVAAPQSTPDLLLSPPPPTPAAAPAAAPAPTLAPPVAPPPAANGSVVAAPVLQSPPVPEAGWRTTPAGLPTPIRPGRGKRMILDLGPTETTVAIAVTLAFVTALILGGVHLVRYLRPAHDEEDTVAAGAPSEDLTKSENKAATAPLMKNSGSATRPIVAGLSQEASEAAMAALLGTWAARSDDGTAAILDFRPEGVAYVYDRMAVAEGAEPSAGRWGVLNKEGDIVTVGIYYAATGLDLHRMQIELASPDCLNLLSTVFQGKVKKWDQRYVRESGPRKDAQP